MNKIKINEVLKINKSINLGIRINQIKCFCIMIVVVKRCEELLKSEFVRG